jgi:hypothetical protein
VWIQFNPPHIAVEPDINTGKRRWSDFVLPGFYCKQTKLRAAGLYCSACIGLNGREFSIETACK